MPKLNCQKDVYLVDLFDRPLQDADQPTISRRSDRATLMVIDRSDNGLGKIADRKVAFRLLDPKEIKHAGRSPAERSSAEKPHQTYHDTLDNLAPCKRYRQLDSVCVIIKL